MTAVGSDSASSQRELNTILSRELLNSVIHLVRSRILATENPGEGHPATQGRALIFNHSKKLQTAFAD